MNFADQQLGHWSPTTTKAPQAEDPVIGPIIKKLKGEISVGDKEKQKLMRTYAIENGLLFRRAAPGIGTGLRLFVPQSMILEVLYANHDHVLAGHFGIAKTVWRLRQYVYWPDLPTDAAGYVRSSPQCQFRKRPNVKPYGPQLTTKPISDSVMKTIAIDLVGRLINTFDDNRYILTVTCQLSKYAIAVPLQTITTEEVLENLERHVFYKFSPPDVLISDNGTQLCSTAAEELYES